MSAHMKPSRNNVVLRVCAWLALGAMGGVSVTAGQAQSAVAAMQTPAGPQAPATTSAKWDAPVMDNRVYTHVMFNQLEGRSSGQGNALRWDGEAWIGTDMNRLWIKSEGYLKGDTMSDGDHEVLYDRPIPRMRYFDAQVGVREDLDSGPNRTWGAVGIEGLAPHFFEFEPTLYFSDGGNVAGRVEGSYDLLLTQRLIAQPEFELNFYNKSDPARGNGSGLSDLDSGVRIRYDIRRKFAPYVGFAYMAKYGETATFARQAGQTVVSPTFVFGLRVWR
jgi:copper resistance protein B